MTEVPHPLAAFLADPDMAKVPLPPRINFSFMHVPAFSPTVQINVSDVGISELDKQFWRGLVDRTARPWFDLMFETTGLAVSSMSFQYDATRDGRGMGVVQVPRLDHAVVTQFLAEADTPWDAQNSLGMRIDLRPGGVSSVSESDTYGEFSPNVVEACLHWLQPLTAAWPCLRAMHGSMRIARPSAHEIARLAAGARTRRGADPA